MEIDRRTLTLTFLEKLENQLSQRNDELEAIIQTTIIEPMNKEIDFYIDTIKNTRGDLKLIIATLETNDHKFIFNERYDDSDYRKEIERNQQILDQISNVKDALNGTLTEPTMRNLRALFKMLKVVDVRDEE